MVQLSATEAAYISIMLTAVGALIGAFATVFAARLSVERQQLYVESAKFRAEFVEEIIKLRSAHEDAFKILSDETIAKHRKAKVLFEPWVSCCKAKSFEDAWSSYEKSDKTAAPGNINNRRNECDMALSQIKSLLLFATHRG